MNLFRQLFSKPTMECPRCLGKGTVDWEDIKRLNNELKWLPGKCAYCNGSGKIDPSLLSKVAANNSYLSLDLDEEERQRLIDGDHDALERSDFYESEIDGFIKQVTYLHFEGQLDVDQIVAFYLINATEDAAVNEKSDLYNYINKIIEHKKNRHEN